MVSIRNKFNFVTNFSSCFIDAGNNFIINQPGNVTFTAGTEGIMLIPNFEANYGSIFWAKIDPNVCSSSSQNPNIVTNTNNVKTIILDTARPENISKKLPLSDLPKEYKLYQNYPNPFNPTTTIKYDLKEDSRVTLIITDILGREVKSLVDGYENAGYKSVIWDGKNDNGQTVSSGIYFYTINTKEYLKTFKMLYIK